MAASRLETAKKKLEQRGFNNQRLPTEKVCSRCGISKSLRKDFHRHGMSVDGRHSICKTCRAKYKTPSKGQIKLLSKYVISLPELKRLQRTKRCQICQRPLSESGKKYRHGLDHDRNIDHDHITGAVRGVLCSQCNLGLGLLGDTTGSIQKVLRYLQNAVAKQSAKQ